MASTEEAEMRTAAVAWGRRRWTGCRVVHELQVGGCRVDLAFITPSHLIGMEIKSSRDTLGRLDTQMRSYCRHLPEVWLAHAPRWTPHFYEDRLPSAVGQIIVANGTVTEEIPWRHGDGGHPNAARPDPMITTPMLWLLLKPELVALGRASGVTIKSRFTSYDIVHLLARALTGDQVVHGVCHHLRARPFGWGGDAPVACKPQESVPILPAETPTPP